LPTPGAGQRVLHLLVRKVARATSIVR
jgi:hypothetical protein